MADDELPKGPLILWLNLGFQGWQPHDCADAGEVMDELVTYGASRYVVTAPPLPAPRYAVSVDWSEALAQRCARCRFFEPEPQWRYGRCRRRAPVRGDTLNSACAEGRGAWPGVYEGDWCGEFEAGRPPTPPGTIPETSGGEG